MKTTRRILTLAAILLGGFLVPNAAQAAVTTEIGGTEAGGAQNGGMDWDINYDDTTRNVTATASGSGWCLVNVQLTSTLSRQVEFVPVAGGTSQNPDIAGATPDFTITADGQSHVIASNVPANQVKRLLGKATATIGGLQFNSEWSRF